MLLLRRSLFLYLLAAIAILLCAVMSDARPAPPKPPQPAPRAGDEDILDGCVYRWSGLKCPETTTAIITTKQSSTADIDKIVLINKLLREESKKLMKSINTMKTTPKT